MPDMEAFRKDLCNLINRHSLESFCDTPDFILADYFIDCFVAYTRTVSHRDRWFDIDMWDNEKSHTDDNTNTSPEPSWNVILEPPTSEPPAPIKITQTRIICKVCGEDLSYWAGVCPKQHDVLGGK